MKGYKQHPGFFYTEYPGYLMEVRPEDEEMDIERCEHCGYVVSECVCHVWFEEY